MGEVSPPPRAHELSPVRRSAIVCENREGFLKMMVFLQSSILLISPNLPAVMQNGLKHGFITPERNESLPVEMRSVRGLLTFAYMPPARHLARKTAEAYNKLLVENGSDPKNSIELYEVKHNQHAEGEYIPRLPHSVDGRDVFLFIAPFDPSYVEDEFQKLFGSLRKGGFLKKGVTLESLMGQSEDSPWKTFSTGQLRKVLNANMKEACNVIRTMRENNARHLVAVSPYGAYFRQNHTTRFERESVLARFTADELVNAGADGYIGFDPHSDDIRGFFPTKDFVVKMIDPDRILYDILKPYAGMDAGFAFLDEGSSKRYHHLQQKLGLSPIYVSKIRGEGEAEIVNIAGYKRGMRTILSADDILATAGTYENAVKQLHALGAKRFIAAMSFGLFTRDAYSVIVNLHQNYGLEEVHISDAIPQPSPIRSLDCVNEFSISGQLAKATNAVHYQASASQHALRPE
jgi:ribose-phosphate pyrophosphokinase